MMNTLSTSSASFLPGMYDEVKPENEQEWSSMEDCFNRTNDLLNLPVISSEYDTINQQFMSADSNCETQDNGALICTENFADYKSNLQFLCEENGGRYDERSHNIVCDQGGSQLIYKVLNYPTCFDANCEAPDLERFISRDVQDLKFAFEDEFQIECDSTYEIEDPGQDGLADNLPGAAGSNATVTTSCPVRSNDTPDKCGPLETSTNGKVCDCYTFCDGVLIGCEQFGTPSSEEIFCNNGQGELVAGCTYQLFGMYDVKGSSALVSSSPYRLMTTTVLAFAISWLLPRI